MSCHAAVRPNPRPPQIDIDESRWCKFLMDNSVFENLSPDQRSDFGADSNLTAAWDTSDNLTSCLKILILKSVLHEFSDITVRNVETILSSGETPTTRIVESM